MNPTQLPFLVEGVLILVAMGLGAWIRATAKPYGKVRLGFHIFFFLWMTMGYAYIAPAFAAHPGNPALWIPLLLMGVTLAVQLVSGIVALVVKVVPKSLPIVHGGSAAVLLLSTVVGFFLAGVA
jgi:hypothetical protein